MYIFSRVVSLANDFARVRWNENPRFNSYGTDSLAVEWFKTHLAESGSRAI